jgi:Tfp pilus assembly PilM family ATPase
MPRTIGIDLGAHTVKVAVSEGGRGGAVQVLHRAVDPAAGPEGPVEALQAVLAELGGEHLGSGAVATFPTEATSLRAIALPFADRARVEQAIPLEVEGVVPFDLDDMVLSWRPLAAEPDRTRALVALAPKARVAARLAEFTAAGLDPRLVVVDADLLADLAGPSPVAVVDLGHHRTLVAWVADGGVVASRAITTGGAAVTSALAEAFSLYTSEAEALKHRTALPGAAEWSDEATAEATHPGRSGGAPASPSETVRAAWFPLLHEVRATLIGFEDTLKIEVPEVLLCGGGALTPGMREELSALLGVPVRLAVANGDGLPAPQSALARAALARGLNPKARSLDLRLGAFAFKGDLARLMLGLKVGTAAAAAVVLLGVVGFAARSIQLTAAQSQAQADIAAAVVKTFPDVDAGRLKDGSTALAIMQERTAATTARVDLLGSIISPEPPVLGHLARISDSVPPNSDAVLDVDELTIADGLITLKGETGGYEEAARIEAAMQKVPGFEQAKRGDEQKKKDKVRFTLTIPLEAPQSEEG